MRFVVDVLFLMRWSGDIENQGPWHNTYAPTCLNLGSVPHRVFMKALDFFLGRQAGILFSWHQAHVVMGLQIPAQTHYMFS